LELENYILSPWINEMNPVMGMATCIKLKDMV
jgi:hypothetical protein